MRQDKFENSIASNEHLHLQVKAIGHSMAGWSYEPGHMEEFANGYKAGGIWAYLVRDSDGLKISFRYDQTWNPKRLVVYGRLPHFQDGRASYFYNSDPEHSLTSEITVAWDKEPAKVAQDIARRLIPDHEKRVARAKERIATGEDYQARKVAAVKAVAVLLGETLTDECLWRNSQIRLGKYNGVQCLVNSGGSFEITIRTESLEQTERIIKAVQKEGGAHEND